MKPSSDVAMKTQVCGRSAWSDHAFAVGAAADPASRPPSTWNSLPVM
jgi:hypothetical protein